MDRGGAYYYVYDGLGSVRALTNAGGTVTDTYAYDAFGNTTHGLGSSPNPYQFNGQSNDGTGLYFLRARYYNPGDGRFLSQDPLMGSDSDPASLHRYLYASGDPINRMDPGGKEDFSLSGVMAASSMAASLGGILDAAEFAIKDQFAAAAGVDISQEKVIAVSIVDSAGLSNEWIGPIQESVQRLEIALMIFQLGSNIVDLGKAIKRANSDPPFSKFEEALSSQDNELADLAGADDEASASGEETEGESEGGFNCEEECLVAGSMIQLANGTLEAIENLQPYDKVLSRNPESGKLEPEFVVKAISRKTPVLVTLTFTNPNTGEVCDTMVCTPDHPLFVKGKGWVPAGMLLHDDLVATGDNNALSVRNITWQRDEKHCFTVYNLTIENDHTYFVGAVAGGIWVHNSCKNEAAKLRRALGDPLDDTPGKWAAHHIVESGRPDAFSRASDDLLKEYQIPINSKENGVYLPNGQKNATAGYTNHGKTFQTKNNSYPKAVNEYLESKIQGVNRADRPAMKDALTKALADIKLKLSTGSGPFPWP